MTMQWGSRGHAYARTHWGSQQARCSAGRREAAAKRDDGDWVPDFECAKSVAAGSSWTCRSGCGSEQANQEGTSGQPSDRACPFAKARLLGTLIGLSQPGSGPASHPHHSDKTRCEMKGSVPSRARCAAKKSAALSCLVLSGLVLGSASFWLHCTAQHRDCRLGRAAHVKQPMVGGRAGVLAGLPTL